MLAYDTGKSRSSSFITFRPVQKHIQGRNQDFTLGGTEAERRKRENRDAKGAQRGGNWGGVSPSPTD